MSWASPAVSTTSGSQPSSSAMPRPIWATSSEWVSRVRGDAAHLGALPRPDDLGLARQPAQRRRVQHPGPVAGERAAPLRSRPTAACFGGSGSIRGAPPGRGPSARRRRHGAQPRPAGLGVHRRVGEPVVEQRAGLPDDVARLGLPGLHHRARCGSATSTPPARLSRAIVPGPQGVPRVGDDQRADSQPSCCRARPRPPAGCRSVSVPSGTAIDGGRGHPALDQVAPARLGLGVGVAGPVRRRS